MNAQREAFDLHHPACRANFRRRLRDCWRIRGWWTLVISDTRNRVCSKKPQDAAHGGRG